MTLLCPLCPKSLACIFRLPIFFFFFEGEFDAVNVTSVRSWHTIQQPLTSILSSVHAGNPSLWSCVHFNVVIGDSREVCGFSYSLSIFFVIKLLLIDETSNSCRRGNKLLQLLRYRNSDKQTIHNSVDNEPVWILVEVMKLFFDRAKG